MRRLRPDALRPALFLAALALASAAPRVAFAQSAATIIGTKHNLSSTGPGAYRASGETRICIFCHTPHNATAASPLWNKELEPVTYQVYASPTLKVAQKLGAVPQPAGPTKLCLSCHDGTIALGAVLNPAGGIAMSGAGSLATGSLTNLGLDLRGHHPVSFRYQDALPNANLASAPPPSLTYGATDEVHCTTCHDPHDDRYGRFLARDNRSSALCTTCHQIPGWSVSAHATSTASVAGVLPRPPKTWPAYTQLGEWGCESCHTPHFASTGEQLLIFTADPPAFSCTTSGCHSGTPGAPHAVASGPIALADAPARKERADIGGQVRKASAHREQPGALSATSGGTANAGCSGLRSVACADCHDPHLTRGLKVEAPGVSGSLQGASGVDRNGARLRTANFEYEICFKCHGDNSGDREFVPRVVPGTNARKSFDPNNPSYHPVVAAGRSPNVPSIPSSLDPTMRATQLIACTSCHADDDGVSRGPHGSAFPPILKQRYETADGTSESAEVYALCYRCHERTSILADASFRKKTIRKTPSGGGHSGHLSAGASCAACHDPHGINPATGPSPAASGDHTSLINFDTHTALPVGSTGYPIFKRNGTFSGSCTLVCHGVTHNGLAYP